MKDTRALMCAAIATFIYVASMLAAVGLIGTWHEQTCSPAQTKEAAK